MGRGGSWSLFLDNHAVDDILRDSVLFLDCESHAVHGRGARITSSGDLDREAANHEREDVPEIWSRISFSEAWQLTACFIWESIFLSF